MSSPLRSLAEQALEPSPATESLGDATTARRAASAESETEPPVSEPDLLDWILEQPVGGDGATEDRPAGSARAPRRSATAALTDEMLLRMAFGDSIPAELAADPEGVQRWRRRAKNRLGAMVAEIDQYLADQINAVLHHPRFQSLEASWRGLWSLAEQADRERTSPIRIRMLSIRNREWISDMINSVAFDQSHLFRKVYEEEFGMPGGLPYGIMIVDFAIGRRPEDVAALEGLAGVAAASFCPMILSADPSLLGLNRWTELPLTQDYESSFRSPEFVRWRRFRESDDAKYLGLALPRVLMRTPYDGRETQGFIFAEDVSDPQGRNYLWGSAAYAFGGVVLRRFAESRWLADIRGVERGIDGGGLVTDLPQHHFSTDRPSIAAKTSLEVILTDRQEAELSRLGFLPLSHCPDTDFAAFYSASSLQKPRAYDDPAVTANARIAAMLQYTLCVSRFAHYLKVMARDWIGSGVEPEELQRRLDRWLKRYVADDADLSIKIKAARPLRKAEVKIERHPTQPGSYHCGIDLWPHYQIDHLTASVHLKTTFISSLGR